jgi:hypothetical protein
MLLRMGCIHICTQTWHKYKENDNVVFPYIQFWRNPRCVLIEHKIPVFAYSEVGRAVYYFGNVCIPSVLINYLENHNILRKGIADIKCVSLFNTLVRNIVQSFKYINTKSYAQETPKRVGRRLCKPTYFCLNLRERIDKL